MTLTKIVSPEPSKVAKMIAGMDLIAVAELLVLLEPVLSLKSQACLSAADREALKSLSHLARSTGELLQFRQRDATE